MKISKCIVFTAIASSLLIASTAYAVSFKVGVVSLAQAKKMKAKPSTAMTPMNQLFVCNSTNLPAQTGTAITVAFPDAGVPSQTPGPGSCAYLIAPGSFTTTVSIYRPAGTPAPSYSNIFNSGQMWTVTYDAQSGSYTVAQIQ
jgi:hypothetical protein